MTAIPATTPSVIRTALMFSGSGTNAVSVVRETHGTPRRLYGLEPVLAIASKECDGKEGVINAGFPKEHVHVIDKTDRDARIIDLFRRYDIHFAMQLGWMPKTGAEVILWINRHGIDATNGHPVSLDPGRTGFGGRHFHGKIAVDAWLRFAHATGRDYIEPTIQLVHPTMYDEGDLLDSCLVPIDAKNDSVEDVQKRAGPAENLLTVKFACGVARTGRLSIEVRSEPLVQPHEMDAWRQARAEALAAHGINPND